MGGNVAGVLANEHPDEVVSLTLMEPQGVEAPIPSEMDVLVRAGQAPLVPARPADFDHLVELAFVKRPFIPRAVYLHLRHQALTLAPLHRRIWNDLCSPEHLYLLEQNLPGIRAPTLVIWGDSDRFLHASTLEKLMTGLRDVQVVRMRACGHAPMLERPAEAARHFLSFVARLAERPATQN
jgi:pimeloyl-ACP methyl ester carboxylesterase